MPPASSSSLIYTSQSSNPTPSPSSSSSSSSISSPPTTVFTSTTPQTPTPKSHTIILSVVLSILAVTLFAIVIYFTLRAKRRKNGRLMDEGPYQGTEMDREHPAAQITPFGSPAPETPRFRHTPGSDMRIALRRPDGAWQFGERCAPFSPSGVSDIDVLPSPLSRRSFAPFQDNNSTMGASSNSSRPVSKRMSTKEQAEEAAKALYNFKAYGRDDEIEGYLEQPPPAYFYDDRDSVSDGSVAGRRSRTVSTVSRTVSTATLTR